MVNPFCAPMVPTTSADHERLRPVGRNAQTHLEIVDHRRQLVVWPMTWHLANSPRVNITSIPKASKRFGITA